MVVIILLCKSTVFFAITQIFQQKHMHICGKFDGKSACACVCHFFFVSLQRKRCDNTNLYSFNT